MKFFELEGRFPTHTAELPPAAVEYVAGLVKVAASELAQYEWSGRTIEYHRAQIREASGFREPTRAVPIAQAWVQSALERGYIETGWNESTRYNITAAGRNAAGVRTGRFVSEKARAGEPSRRS